MDDCCTFHENSTFVTGRKKGHEIQNLRGSHTQGLAEFSHSSIHTYKYHVLPDAYHCQLLDRLSLCRAVFCRCPQLRRKRTRATKMTFRVVVVFEKIKYGTRRSITSLLVCIETITCTCLGRFPEILASYILRHNTRFLDVIQMTL